MAPLLIVFVSVLLLASVNSAPTMKVNDRISSNMMFFDMDKSNDVLSRNIIQYDKANTGRIPVISERFPELDDERQNWGILVNESIYDENDETDYSRPINIPRPEAFAKETNVKEIQHSNLPKNAASKNILLEKLSKAQVAAKESKELKKFCDIAHITCCINSSDMKNCLDASRCLNLKISQSTICDKKIVYDALMRIKHILR